MRPSCRTTDMCPLRASDDKILWRCADTAGQNFDVLGRTRRGAPTLRWLIVVNQSARGRCSVLFGLLGALWGPEAGAGDRPYVTDSVASCSPLGCTQVTRSEKMGQTGKC